MYAYIKLVISGKFTIVDLNQIIKYKKNNQSKIFKVNIDGKVYECLVIHTAESELDLSKKINSGGRVRVPPLSLLSGPSEDEEIVKKPPSEIIDQTSEIMNKRLQQIDKSNELPMATGKRRMNNRLLNPNCDPKTVSKRTVYRWKKCVADIEKKRKIEIESSTVENSSDETCCNTSQNIESLAYDDIPIINEHINIDMDNESIVDEMSCNSSCKDTSSTYSCSTDETYSESDFDIAEDISSETATFDTRRINGDRIMFPAANLKVSDVVLMVEMFSLSKHLTESAENDMLDFVKILAGPDFEHWECSYYSRSKIYDVPDDKIKLIFFCESCKVILKTKTLKMSSKKEKIQCDNCREQLIISSQSNNYFMNVDLRFQIQLILNQPKIHDNIFSNITPNNISSNMNDIQDSILCREIKNKYPGILTLNYNTDGAPLFKSSKKSFWPQQLYINDLPLEQRFKHIILGGLFLTDVEPKSTLMNLYNMTLCDQILDLMNNGVDIINYSTGKIFNVKLTLLCCCVDTPARAMCQNRIQFNGYWGCSWCYHRGIYVGNAVHYPLCEAEPDIRSHKKHIDDIREVEKINQSSESKNKLNTVMGVKGTMAFVEKLPVFDSIWGFPIDYMHGCLLGVTLQLLHLLKSPGVKFKLTAQQWLKVDQRLMSMTPPHELHRLPRSTAVLSKWKASELESWLLYWSLPCLDGIADPKFLEMYALLVRSVFTLLKKSISDGEIQRSEYDLLKFVGYFQMAFSEAAVTFNVHSLLHLCESVKKSGPLFGTSAFPFENGIFKLKTEVTGPRSVSHQMVKRFLKRKYLLSQLKSLTSSLKCENFCDGLFNHSKLKDCLKLPGDIILRDETNVTQCIEDRIKMHVDDPSASIQAFKKCIYKKSVIHSAAYTRGKKNNDTYIHLQSGQIIHIHHLIVVKEECYIYGCLVKINPYSIGNVKVDHIHYILNKCDEIVIINAKKFKEKAIYSKVDNNEYIFLFPYILNMN